MLNSIVAPLFLFIFYDLLKLMRDKIGCFTLHYMPNQWQMNCDHRESVLAHLAGQKLLQLPHFV